MTTLRYVGSAAVAVFGEYRWDHDGLSQEVPDEVARKILSRPNASFEWEIVGDAPATPASTKPQTPAPEPEDEGSDDDDEGPLEQLGDFLRG